jgi:hypothetical protein
MGPDGPNLTPDDVATQEKICLKYVRSQPLSDDGGATAAETRQALGWTDTSTVSARFPGLKKKGLIAPRMNPETGKFHMRKTPIGGRPAVVYWPVSELKFQEKEKVS